MHLRLCSSYSSAVSAVGSVSGQGTRSASACGLTSSWRRRTRSQCSGYAFDNVCSMSTRTFSFRTGLGYSTNSVSSSSPLLSTGLSTHHPSICMASARNMYRSSFSSRSSWRLAHTHAVTPRPSLYHDTGRRGVGNNGRGELRDGTRRGFGSTAAVSHNPITKPEPGTGIKVHFRDSKGNDLKTIEANEGDSILDLAHEYDIDLEGACEGSVACSTCHVILEPDKYDLLPEPEDEENDMLDMAFGLTDTSRLGCQVQIKRELDGMVVTLPSATRNMFVDGLKPTKH